MKKSMSTKLTGLLLVLLMISISTGATKWIVNVQNFAFNPDNLPAVVLGDTIRWQWISGSHTTTTTAPNIPPGASVWNSAINSTVQFFEYVPALTGNYYYWCTPHLGMGMDATFTVSAPPGFAFNLKIFLEGPYNGSGMNTSLADKGFMPLDQPFSPALPYYGNNNPSWYYAGTEAVESLPTEIVDWVMVELRDAPNGMSATGATMIDRQALFLRSDGMIVALNGSSVPTTNVNVTQGLFAVIYHRNHLAVMNANPIAGLGGTYTLDFTTGAGNFYGGAAGCTELSPGIWGMTASDGNADNMVDIADKNNVWHMEAGYSGYLGGDFSSGAESDNTDKNLYWLPNLGKSSQVP